MRDRFSLYWGDLHTHFQDLAQGDFLLQAARENIDFTAVLCYPFFQEEKNGFLIETTRQRPEFLTWWARVNELSAKHHQPGRFVTFPGYEWHGNRTRYGDHNVIYQQEGFPLDDTWSLPTLYRKMKKRLALVIPHHTAYYVGFRGKDWRYFDPQPSPLMEIFSSHGSSEGIETPRSLETNINMGPLTSGGSFQDGLAFGHQIGVIGSNDGPGLPGRWGLGRAAVWAEELTRESLWEAFQSRRTYAVTGDRITLELWAEGKPMGSIFQAGRTVELEVNLECSSFLDRVELIHNNLRTESFIPQPSSQISSWQKHYKVRVEMGWGPANSRGFSYPSGTYWKWKGSLVVKNGRLRQTEKCITLPGQKLAFEQQGGRWYFRTRIRTDTGLAGIRQGSGDQGEFSF
ncbi:MAG: DUF3604 domain-containing protein [Candidatus Omnitrophica bacterium]|nr:DUF3604 domain-containing protein [Candidatus Omnitrophota bacterium]